MARKGAAKGKVIRRTYELAVPLDRRLGAYARIQGLRECEVVAQALSLYLRGFTVSVGVNPSRGIDGEAGEKDGPREAQVA